MYLNFSNNIYFLVDLQLKESEKELDLELKETRSLSYIFVTMVHHFVLEDLLCASKRHNFTYPPVELQKMPALNFVLINSI